MKPVDNWKSAHKWMSIHCMSAAAAIQGAWVYIPEDLRQSLNPKIISGATVALLCLGIVGRLFKRGK